jgi:SsrA-binding protein
MASKGSGSGTRNFAVNRQAQHYYHLLEKFEAGIELTGTEVKSIRAGKASLKDSYAAVRRNEAWLVDCHISTYLAGSYLNHEPLRERRLLLHREELDKLAAKTQEKGLTLIPLRLYSKGNRVKVELALAKGKKLYDHREAARRRAIDRETEQAIRAHRRHQT